MKKVLIFVIVILIASLGISFAIITNRDKSPQVMAQSKKVATPKLPSFKDTFGKTYVLQEAGKMYKSLSTNWWLNSGGLFVVKNGVGQTIQGRLAESALWRQKYGSSNPAETDNGYHPQNIFRLVTRSKWRNLQQDAYFKITADNLSGDEHRQASNGLLLFNRYQDGYNLYYTGIRVDGYAVVKKKIKGVYYTMALKQIFPGTEYDRKSNPNLLPKKKWIGLRSIVTTNKDKTVSIKLFMDENWKGNWKLICEATDDGKKYGGKPFLDKQYAGIRTDFMDVQFDNYKIQGLP